MNRICVLTGSSGPLGTEFVRRCGSKFDVVAVYWGSPPLFPTQDQSYIDPLDPGCNANENRQRAFGIRSDLSSDASIDQLCREVIERFGRIDLLVNAAAHRRFAALLDPEALQDAEYMMRVNVLAPIRLTVGFAHHFWAMQVDENVRLRRNVVNVSSTAGQYVYEDLGQSLYSASKAALNFATYHMASELWNIGVRVNAVAPNTFPGIVPTENVVRQILAFDSSLETGQVINLDQ